MEIAKEEWQDIEYYSYYQVSNHGRVKSLDCVTEDCNGRLMQFRGKILAQHAVWANGHITSMRVTLRNRGAGASKIYGQSTLVSRLVAKAFIGPQPRNMECCHNDGDATNNKAVNLRWDIRERNVADIYKHGKKRRDVLSERLSAGPFSSAYLCGLMGAIG